MNFRGGLIRAVRVARSQGESEPGEREDDGDGWSAGHEARPGGGGQPLLVASGGFLAPLGLTGLGRAASGGIDAFVFTFGSS